MLDAGGTALVDGDADADVLEADEELRPEVVGAGLVTDEELAGTDVARVTERDGEAGGDEVGATEVDAGEVDGVTTVARRCGTW